MAFSVRTLLLPAVLLVLPTVASAQAPLVTDQTPSSAVAQAPAIVTGATPLTTAATAPVAGQLAEAQPVALKARTAPAPAPKAPRGDTSNNRALMIVGGVGLVIGAVIGGDAGTLVMLGSAGVGLLGLYRFLQ
ncbi:hypothetical protein [Gemmatimonas phototrophica]|uniref:Uncharacterized protein n=1 Tax=Gemmatimonas phototrophica TaxID=1379270 RepID=A0A143BKH3_9BACT|nr:hypothetical protein [Gemmatimonas phototrophica]AMW05539.1 hypothetical protein GEMMAAP_13425 [Gemmatimonas phototrophica]